MSKEYLMFKDYSSEQMVDIEGDIDHLLSSNEFLGKLPIDG